MLFELHIWSVSMNWMKIGEEHATNRARVGILIGLPGMAVIIIGGAALYAGLSAAAKLFGF